MLYISHLLEDDEMKQLISDTGMGVESIEFSIAENLDRLEEKQEQYRSRLQKMWDIVPEKGNTSVRETSMEPEKIQMLQNCVSFGKCLTLHGPFLDLNPAAFDSLVQKATRMRYEQCYRAAQALGARKIIFHSCFVPTIYFMEGWAERVADFMNRFLADKSDKIQILMENVWDPFPGSLRDVAERISHPAFGICLDVGHAHCYSEIPCEEWIAVLKPYIRHLHIHDNCGDRDSHMSFGQGTVRTEKILELLENGMDATIECRTALDVMSTYEVCIAGQSKSAERGNAYEYIGTVG